MTNEAPPDQLTFKIHPAEGGSEVPVSMLTQCLTTLQELIHLFALQEEGRELRTRLRLSGELKSKYVLRCGPPVTGSFAVTGRVARLAGDLYAAEDVSRVVQNFHEFGHAAVANSHSRLQELVADSRLRHRILTCFIALSPPAGSGYRYEVLNGTGPGFALEESLPSRIEGWLSTPEERAEVQTVTGRLEAISFSEHKVTIQYAPKGRWLECLYDDDLEPMLFEKRRDLIQVTGRVIADDDGHPKKIVEVDEIRELDLSPFVVTEVGAADWKIRPKQPVKLTPTLSDSEQLLCLAHPAWDLDVFAATRSELFRELKEQLVMLWQEYVREDEDVLSEPAKQLRTRLMQDFEEQVEVKKLAEKIEEATHA